MHHEGGLKLAGRRQHCDERDRRSTEAQESSKSRWLAPQYLPREQS
jgi:hypothetical protein